MDIYWYGQSCFKLKGKSATVVIDPYTPDFVGFKAPKDLEGDVILTTHEHQDHNGVTSVSGNPPVFSGPGEYEVKGVVMTGISAFHDNAEGLERGLNTIYHLSFDRLNVVHLGDLGQNVLTEQQISLISQTDVLLIPVGGSFTISGKEAAGIVSQLEPRIIIPMHYKIDGLKFDLETVDNFLKEMGVENIVTQPKLSITRDKLPDEPQVVVLSKS